MNGATVDEPFSVNGLPVTTAVASLASVSTPGRSVAVMVISQLAEPALASRGVPGLQAAAKADVPCKESNERARIPASRILVHNLCAGTFR